MNDLRLGTAVRLVRIRRGWRLADLAERARVSTSFVSRLERGHVGPQSVDRIRAVAAALEIRVDLVPRWRAGDLDRLLNAKHSVLHESVAKWLRTTYPAWTLAPEVSFAFYSDRGIVDLLAWHPGRRALLIIELKTDIADVNELLGSLDRKRRVAQRIANERGWDPKMVSVWLIVAASRTNRRRVEAHRTMIRGAFPLGGPAVRRWLRDPVGVAAGMSFWSEPASETTLGNRTVVRRVRIRPEARAAARIEAPRG